MSFAADWNTVTDVLCIRLDNIGDLLMTTPALRALKQAGKRVTVLTSSAAAAIASLIPEIDDTIIFDAPWVKQPAMQGSEAVDEAVAKIQARGFDAAIIFTVYSQNPLPAAMLCYQAGIPHVLGYCRENPYELMDAWVPDPEPLETIRHEVERQLELVAAIKATTDDTRLSLTVDAALQQQAAEKLRAHNLDLDKPWLILHAGASEAKRRFLLEQYGQAGRALVQKGWQIVLTGSAGEKADAETVAAAIGEGAINVAGELSLPELAAAISRASALISNNTGPVHIAAAVGTPVVVAYAKTNPQHTPWQVPSRVLYFDVPEELRSRNRLLQTFPGPSEPVATADSIVTAIQELQVLRV